MFGLGCFWGAERAFWQLDGVYSTAVGYAGGYTPNATYEEVCTGLTGHNEVVLVMFDPGDISYQALLHVFWQTHNPTQGMRQGNDRGTQYRSGIYTFDDWQHQQALDSCAHYAQALKAAGYAAITTEILAAPTFIMLRITINNTWQKIQAATAVWVVPVLRLVAEFSNGNKLAGFRKFNFKLTVYACMQ